ncbi:MAG: hypothetical protein IJ064_07885 [Bacteroidaceae bacterium]|nr:hypothetical protein [Bacteroidaceae bacterium]
MEKLIRIMTNNRTANEQTNLVENMNELMELAGVTAVCMMVLVAMTVF